MKIKLKTDKNITEIKQCVVKYAEKSVHANWDKNSVIYKLRKSSFILTYHKANLSAPTRNLYCKIIKTDDDCEISAFTSSLILDIKIYLFLLVFSSLIPCLYMITEFINVISFKEVWIVLTTALVFELFIFLFFSSFLFIASLISNILPLKNQEEALINKLYEILEIPNTD